MLRTIVSIIPICFLLIASACGSISTATARNDQTDTSVSSDPDGADSQVFVFATDFTSSGQLYTATLTAGQTELSQSGVTLLGTEARIRYANDLLYVLHAGGNYNSVSTDNLQILDPFAVNSPFTTLGQFSTGNGTNPMDVAIDGTRAFISLYNPRADPNNIDDSGNPADVIEMDTETGKITRRYSFYDSLQDDGDKNGNAYCLLLVNNILFVCLQDLESTTFEPTAPGLIGLIDIEANQILGVITLTGRNPASLAVSDDASRLFVSLTHDFGYDSDYGGLEVINLDTYESELFIKDSSFSGYVEKLKTTEDYVFAVVSRYDTATFVFESKIVKFPQDISGPSDVKTFKQYGPDIRDLFLQNGVVWVSYRVISTTEGDSEPSIKVFDIQTGKQIGETLRPVVAGISIAGR